jgi:predicted PurR-regulated permease PerM
VSRSVRDTAVVTVALALAVWEIMLGGARPAVLSFLGAILLSPLVMRVDEARRRNGNAR